MIPGPIDPSLEQARQQLNALSAELAALKATYESEIEQRRVIEQELRLLLTITQAIAAATDFNAALEITLKTIADSAGWAMSEAWVPSRDGSVLQWSVSWHDGSPELADIQRYSRDVRYSRGEGLIGRVWESKRREWVRDIAGVPNNPRLDRLRSGGLRAALGVPVVEDGEVLCVLVFFMREAREEQSRTVEVVSAIGRQLGAAIKQKQTEEELRRARRELEQRVQQTSIELEIATEASQRQSAERERAEEEVHVRKRQQAAVTRIGEWALNSSNLSRIMDAACVAVSETLAVEFCKVLELQPDQSLLLRAGVGWQPGLVGRQVVAEGLQSQAGFTLATAGPVIVEDLASENRFGPSSLLVEHGVVSGLSVIISGKDGPWGVLGVHTRKRRSFSADDVHFLQTVANVLSEAIARSQFEQEVQRSEAWLRSLIAATQDALVSIDRGGRIVMFNPSAERIFGYTAAEIVGRKVNELMAEPYASEHDEYIARYERTGESHAIGRIRTVTARRKSGELFPIELSLTKVTDNEDVRYAAFIRDISEKNRLQELLVETERLAAIGKTAAKIGHELANPLNGVFLTIQLLEQRLRRQPNPPDDQINATIKRLKDEISRLNRLVGEFRTIARREKYEFRPERIADVISEVTRLQQPYFSQAGIQVEVSVPDDLPPVRLDRDKIQQVLLNLLKNAAEAMPGGGRIRIEASLTERGMALDVSDTGPGISPDIDPFEPFFTTKKDGTGIGLMIVRQIVTAHGGEIRYWSESGKGTTFRMELPGK